MLLSWRCHLFLPSPGCRKLDLEKGGLTPSLGIYRPKQALIVLQVMDVSVTMLPMPMTPAEVEDQRKAIRKQKNRASAAATRARREEYTANLETQVCHCETEL